MGGTLFDNGKSGHSSVKRPKESLESRKSIKGNRIDHRNRKKEENRARENEMGLEGGGGWCSPAVPFDATK